MANGWAPDTESHGSVDEASLVTPPGTYSDRLYESDPIAAYEALAADLADAIEGEVAFDEYAQLLYATDGSIYQAKPAGVVHPRHAGDVQAVMRIAHEHEVPVLPRGAGSSLAGQAVGPGCIVLDFTTYMDAILEIDPSGNRATVQPGVVQDHLDDALEPHGLKFAPDPASSNRATIGGGIGNNSTGAHSVRYGITDAYTEELRVVLANGEVIHTREVVLDSDEWEAIVSADTREATIYETVRRLVEDNEAEIVERYPSLKRCVSGYNLQKVISENEAGEDVINLSKLFVGAEGTLGCVVEATVSLVTKPTETALALYCFEDLFDALEAVPQALEYPVSAVELMDDEVFRLAANSDGYAEYVEPIPDNCAAALMLEWDDELVTGEDQQAAFREAVGATNERFIANGTAFDVIEAYDQADQNRLWKLRKAAIPLLMSLEGDPKPYPFIEDATVPPAELATYVSSFQEVLEAHDTSAAYFAHAGSGTLHIRPVLNLKDEADIERMHSITDAVTDLVLDHDGAFSGEHGDGMARTEFTPKMYGEQLWRAFKELKTAFDPEWLCHPGNVVYRDGPDDIGPDCERGVGADMREHLRYGPTYQSVEPQTSLDFSDDGGFSNLVELCNGCGTCRQTESDVMCPTYRAANDEIQTTRGRANLLRAAISGDLSREELHSERFQTEVLDMCVGCKGCQSDCPTGVDMAKLKAELKHQYHQEHGSSRRDRLFANVDSYAALGSRLAPLANTVNKLPGAGLLQEKLFGIAADRPLPTFTRETFVDWFDARGDAAIPLGQADDKVLLVPDTFTNYCNPEPGKAAVDVLERAGIHVSVPDFLEPSGRAAHSLGFLDEARAQAERNVESLLPYVRDGWDILFLEPADAVMFQDEYLSLLGPDSSTLHSTQEETAAPATDGGPSPVEAVANATWSVMAYLDRERVDEALSFTELDETLTYHGHCNQQALRRDHHAVAVLRRAGYEVDPLDSSCCGMAGSFGYEAEHYDLSMAIGERVAKQVRASPGDSVVAPGSSCRTQFSDVLGDTTSRHPIEKVQAALE